MEHGLAPAHVEASAYFGEWFQADAPHVLQYYLVFMAVGVLIGGFISALGSRRISAVHRARPADLGARAGCCFALCGGVLVGFASRLARGCTSGQALSGTALLLSGSVVFLISLFAARLRRGLLRAEGMAMNGTLFSLDLLNTPVGFLVAGLIGLLFGFFLEQAGFGSSRKLTGIFYFKDMAVLKVMFTAIVVALVGYRYLTALGWLQPADVYIMPTYWGAAIVGGLIFGVGFVMGGWCPGTAIVGLASAKLDALVFLVGAVLGGILFNEIYGVVEPLYNGLCAGAVTLSDTLGVSMNVLTLALCVIAVLLFAGCGLA